MDISDLLIITRERGASDLHLAVGAPPMLRVRGRIQPTEFDPLTREDIHEMLYQMLTEVQQARFEETHDLDFSVQIGGLGRFRVNIFMQRRGEGAVFRVIDDRIRSFEELGLPPVVRSLATKDRGLVLVTGPTGSGKSTTLAAMINLINEERFGHILTIEDPIEFVHEHKNCIVNQREVETHTASFAAALRSALREDPDVILIGELRDLETTALAITAAETGHVVLGTLHTSSAAQTIDRIIDIFPPEQQAQIRAQLSESLQGVIAQMLLPTLDGQGRVAALEVMVATSAVRNLIREGKTFQIPSVIQTAKQEGMQSMEQALRDLVMRGRIARATALEVAPDKRAFELMA
jgi:twitching motility protein PilT